MAMPGNELMALGVRRGIAFAEVVFGIRHHDAGGGAGFGAVEDAADVAVGEDVADAEFVGVVDPFDDVGADMSGGRGGRGTCGRGWGLGSVLEVFG